MLPSLLARRPSFLQGAQTSVTVSSGPIPTRQSESPPPPPPGEPLRHPPAEIPLRPQSSAQGVSPRRHHIPRHRCPDALQHESASAPPGPTSCSSTAPRCPHPSRGSCPRVRVSFARALQTLPPPPQFPPLHTGPVPRSPTVPQFHALVSAAVLPHRQALPSRSQSAPLNGPSPGPERPHRVERRCTSRSVPTRRRSRYP